MSTNGPRAAKKIGTMFLAAAAASVLPTSTVLGVTKTWNGPDGGFWGDSTWTPGFPFPGDDAVLGTINAFSAINLNVTYNAAVVGVYNSITLDSTALSGSMILNQTLTGGTVMNATTEYVGKTVPLNVYNQTTGDNNVTTLYIAHGVNATGTYNLSAGGMLNSGDCYVGFGGSAVFTQTGGTHHSTSAIVVGANSGSAGTYNLTGGTTIANNFNLATGAASGIVTLGGTGVLTTVTELIGSFGTGNFTQFGGTHTSSNLVVISNTPGVSTGTYNLLLGTFKAKSIVLNTGGIFNQTNGILNAATFTQSGGMVLNTLQNQGDFVYNSGTFNGRLLNQGTLILNADFTAANGMQNDSVINLFGGPAMTLNGAGLDNQGTFNLMGGTLNLSASATNTNFGNFNLTSIAPLRLNGATLTNGGSMNLNGALLSGPGTLNNTVGGIITGQGNITATFNNAGGVVLVQGGTTRIANAFANTGIVQLGSASANFTGGSVNNVATIQGLGTIANNITNNAGGTIEAIGGTLIVGTLHNNAGGILSAPAGAKLLVSAGLTSNLGTITLSGGTFDNNGIDASNGGTISGWGTFRAPNLSNLATASIVLTGGNTTVQGSVNNAAGASIKVLYNPVIITGNLVNNGSVKTTATTLTVVGAYSGSGSYVSDPSDNFFLSGAAINGGGSMTGGVGDRFFMQSSFANGGTFTNAGLLDGGEMANTGTFSQSGPLSVRASSTFSSSGTTTISGAQTWGAGTKLKVTAGSTTLNTNSGGAGATLNLDASGGATTLNATQNLASVSVTSALVKLSANGNRTLYTGALTVSSTGNLDLADNDLVVAAASFTTIQNLVLSGFGSTAGITSSTSSGSQILALFDNALVGAGEWNGQAISANAIVGKYTFFGDANFDGQVTGDDYTVIDANLGTTPLAGLAWLSGDANLDGNVTGDDYTVIDANLGLGAGNPLTPSVLAAVPEPTTIAVLSAAAGIMRRRRRPYKKTRV